MLGTQTDLPALLNKNFPYPAGTIATSYPEGVVVLEDSQGLDILDEEFEYIDMKQIQRA